MITLRPYQADLVRQTYEHWNAGVRNVMLVLPTGGGKSLCISQVALDRDQMGATQCIMAHRTELVSQMSMHVARRGVKHRIIAPSNIVRQITNEHREAFNGKSFINPDARCAVAAAQTLVARSESLKQWGQQVHNWTVDEQHHLLREPNLWGKAVGLFPNAIGLGVTATPARADGMGLGRHADGLIDAMLIGPSMRQLIDEGSLTEYEIVLPSSDFTISEDAITAGGDFSRTKMRDATKQSHLIGDVVTEYTRRAWGRSTMCFATDVESANEIAARFNEVGIPAASLSAKTDPTIRRDMIRRLRDGKIWVLVNVDLFDEGFDCLDIETEILTPNGWKNWLDAALETECYAWNSVTGEAEIVPIENHGHRLLRDGEHMLEIESQHTSIRVTEGHRFYQRNVNYYRYGGMSPDVTVRTGAEIHDDPKNKFALPLCGEKSFIGVPITDDEIRIIGWYMTDGYLERGNSLEISQVKTHQIENIRNVLDRLGWKYYEKSRTVTNSYNPGTVCTYFRIPRREIQHLLPYMDKRNPPHILNDMTKEQFRILWSSMMDGNGSGNHGNHSGEIVTMHRKQADFFGAMAAVRGFATMFGTYQTQNNVTMYNMRTRDEKWMQFYQKDKRGARFTMSNPDQREMVWCIENRLGTLITRRNGKVVVLGNCPGIDVVIMARPTASLGKYLQQFGRCLRPDPNNPSKVALVIDHVSNVIRHGLPDKVRQWSLDRREKRAKRERDPEEIDLTVCRGCSRPYEKCYPACPYCGWVVPAPEGGRRTIEQVDGDLVLLDREALARLRAATQLESPASVAERVERAAGPIAGKAAYNRAVDRHGARERAEAAIAQWAGIQRAKGRSDSETYRRFYHTVGADVWTALSGDRSELEALEQRVRGWYEQ